MVDIQASTHKQQVEINFSCVMLMFDAAAASDRPMCKGASFVAETRCRSRCSVAVFVVPLQEHISAAAAPFFVGLFRHALAASLRQRATPVCTWPALCVVL